MTNTETMQKEIAAFFDSMSDKYFISTWQYSVAVRGDDGVEEVGQFDGSLPEAIGLTMGMHQNLMDSRGNRNIE